METTREQILRFVRGHRETTVARLAEALDVSQQAVRRHLDSLRADGLLDVRLDRHGVGRPALIFFATERGEEVSGRTYLQLLLRLFRHLEKGSTGLNGAVLDRVFSGIAEEVAADHEAEVRGGSLDERIAQASLALEREGIVDGWRRDEDGSYLIHNGECPYLRLAEMSTAPCHADRQSIELLVRAPVEQISRIVEGGPVCEYIVRPDLAPVLSEQPRTRRPEPADKRAIRPAVTDKARSERSIKTKT